MSRRDDLLGNHGAEAALLLPLTGRAMQLSQTLQRLAAMSADEAHYWGQEVYEAYGARVYDVFEDLTAIPRSLRHVLGTVWVALWVADDIPARVRTKNCSKRA